MSAPYHYLRLFNLKEYREIQPILEGIKEGNVDLERAVHLVERAFAVLETDEFKKYNNKKHYYDSYTEELQDALDVLRKPRLSEWSFLEGCYTSEKTTLIIDLLCCPKYQSYWDNKPDDSDTTIDYSDYYGLISYFNEELSDYIHFSLGEYPESLPSDRNDSVQLIFSSQQLNKINELLSSDLATLSDPNNILYKVKTGQVFWRFDFFSKPPQSQDLEQGEVAIPAPESRATLINIYSKLAHLLDLARSNPDFTIVSDLAY
jgi:hypothetical protein